RTRTIASRRAPRSSRARPLAGPLQESCSRFPHFCGMFGQSDPGVNTRGQLAVDAWLLRMDRLGCPDESRGPTQESLEDAAKIGECEADKQRDDERQAPSRRPHADAANGRLS